MLTLALAVPVIGVVLNGDPRACAAPAATVRGSSVGEVLDVAIGEDDTAYVVGSFTQAGAAATNVSRLDSNAVVSRTFTRPMG